MNPIPLLIVEDNPIYAEVLQRLLPALGTDLKFDVSWVDTAEKALEIVQQKKFDIVLLDYRLPTADGLTVLAGIRSGPATNQPAVIMLTGMGREEIAVEAMKCGAKDYLSKDQLDVASLLRAITSALERRHLEEQIARYTTELRERNAQLQADLNMARDIQEAFLPQSYPTFPAGAPASESALQFCYRYLPTTAVGGDFFDVLALPGDKAGVFISDVMGHGVRAALVTAILRAFAEELASVAEDPGLFLTEMNHRMLGLLRRTRMPMFASACYLVADPTAGTLRFAVAGHPVPLTVRRETAAVEPLPLAGGKPGPALGVFEDTKYEVFNATLAAHDLVVLFTDGLFEVGGHDGQMYGQPRVIEALRQRVHMQTEHLFDELLDEVHRFSAQPEFVDDVCLVGMDVLRWSEMKRRILIALCLAAVTASAETPTGLLGTQQVTRVGSEVRVPGLRIVGGDKKYVEATGKISPTDNVLEFIAVEAGGRDYESLLTLDCKPSALKFGLLLIGCEEGETNGSPLSLEIEWQGDGKEKRLPIESLLLDRHTGKAPGPLPFFFSGSFFGQDIFTTNQIFHADVEQAHIALWWQPAVLINIRGDQGNPYRGNEQGFEVNSKLVPKVGTPIKLILRKREP